MSTFSVNLTRGNGASPWGFRLQGGADFRSPLVLQRVNPRSIAEQSGLNVGDVILEINGSSTTPMRHQEAQQSIINSGNRITLKISRADMSYHRYNYTSPLGTGSYHSSSYTSPSGSNRYSSNYESSTTSGGLGSRYGLGSSYGGSLGNLSSSRYGDYGSHSPYSGSSYTPRSKYDSSSLTHKPWSDYSRYSKPLSSYGTGSASKYRSTDFDSDSSYSRPARKTRFADEESSSPRTAKKDTKPPSSAKSARTDESVSKARQRRKEKEQGANPLPTAAAPPPAADPDVAAVTLKTAKLAVDSTASQPRAPSPSFQEFGKQAVESARYKEQVNDTPQYRPYTNPNLQSQSFKSLQSTIDSGRDPGSYFQQAPWQSATVNKVESEPRKYAPSKTWAAVHAEGRGGGDKGGVPPAPQAGPYKPPPADRYRDVGSKDQYKPPSYNNPKPAGGPKPFTPPAPSPQAAGDNLATKGTSAFNQSANSDKIPICAKCDCDIRGPFVLALNKSWCPNHFTCSKCNSELVNMGFVELNGSIYCENDYQNFFAPKCAKCRQAIIGDTVNALEKTWHPACFACEECGEAISSGAFHVEEGRPYCMKDWTRLFSTKCIGCSYPVEPGDKWIEALDANWHSECFVCGVCRMQLEGKPFFPRDGKPFCRDHATA